MPDMSQNEGAVGEARAPAGPRVAIQLSSVRRQLGEVQAVDGLNLQVRTKSKEFGGGSRAGSAARGLQVPSRSSWQRHSRATR